MFDIADRFDQSSTRLTQSLHDELLTLTRTVREERVAISGTFDAQRAAFMQDAAQVANQVTESSWRHIGRLGREFALYWLLTVILVLGMPFVAGYLVGRAQAARGRV
jgi:hypothetical protein